jgi:hypothetical protein
MAWWECEAVTPPPTPPFFGVSQNFLVSGAHFFTFPDLKNPSVAGKIPRYRIA